MAVVDAALRESPPAATPVSAPLALLRGLAGLVLIAMVALNVVNAAGRYTIGLVFVGADELLVFSMIWMVMVGAVVAVAERSHLSLDMLPLRLHGRARTALYAFHGVVMTIACGCAAWQSLAFVTKIGRLGQTSMGLGIPMAVAHSALLVGFTGMAVVALWLTVRDLAAVFGRGAGPEARA